MIPHVHGFRRHQDILDLPQSKQVTYGVVDWPLLISWLLLDVCKQVASSGSHLSWKDEGAGTDTCTCMS